MTGLVLLSRGASQAQQPEETFILRAVALFLRDSLPKPIVVDAQMFRAGPAISPTVADDLASTIGATRDHLADLMECSTAQPTKKDCVVRDRKTVLSFA